jgi:peptidoglycan/xylan/chitin deacetylase (PgdA/CDA1 family)
MRRAICIVAIAFALTACGGDGSTPTATPEPAPATLIERAPNAASSQVSLTFDAVVGSGEIERILTGLAAENVRAAFAVTGVWAEANTGLLNAIAAAGHQIINLTYDGASFTGASTGTPPLDADARALALSRAEATIFRNTSRSTRPFMRPPHGDVDDSVRADAGRNGYAYAVTWSVDLRDNSADDDTPPADAEILIGRARAEVNGGDIVLLDAQSPVTVEALPGLVAALRERGLELATVSMMLEE